MNRLGGLRELLLALLTILVVRLVHLQVIRGGFYRRLADQNRLRLVPEEAPRGLIVDRKGVILASNQTVFRVAIVPQEVEDLSAVLGRVAALLHRPAAALNREYLKERSLAFVPTVIAPRVPKEIAIQLEEDRWHLPGLIIKSEAVRHYPLGTTAANLLGYLSQPTAEEMPLLKQYGIRPKRLVGRTGLEQLLDQALQGRSGGLMVEVNHRAKQVRIIGHRPPEPGATVALTIDASLQSLVEQAFGPQPGAAVVLNPETGEVLAMASLPSFAPEAFVTPNSDEVVGYLEDERTPLMNRAAVGVYQPGSIMKLVTGAAALEQHVVKPASSIVCPGYLRIGDRDIHCWNRDGHGPMNLSEALMQSCNVYFMTVARRVGFEALRAAQESVGFSHRTGWPLLEQPGHLPQRRLTEGEVAMLGIGQSEVLVTPLQAAVMVSIFANRGWVVEPWLVNTVADRPLAKRGSRHRVNWSEATINAVRAGMQAVVAEEYGTGHRAFSQRVSIAGKTGTAQTQMPGRTHGWFVGFCPVDHPRAAMAIMVEYGGSGGDLPAEIGKSVCEYLALAPLPQPARASLGGHP